MWGICIWVPAKVIIGATSIQQLKENLDAFEGDPGLSEDVIERVDGIHLKLRSPGTFLWNRSPIDLPNQSLLKKFDGRALQEIARAMSLQARHVSKKTKAEQAY